MAKKVKTPLLEDEQQTLLLALAEGQSNKDIKALMTEKHNRQLEDIYINSFRETWRDKISAAQNKLIANIEDSFMTTNVAYRLKELESIAKKLKDFMLEAKDAKEYKSLSSEYRKVLQQVKEEIDKLDKRTKGNTQTDLAGISDEDLKAMTERQNGGTATPSPDSPNFFKISELK